MCMIMMQMTDFTRGTGPLKNTTDVIESARNIAQLGNNLEALASQIAEVTFTHIECVTYRQMIKRRKLILIRIIFKLF